MKPFEINDSPLVNSAVAYVLKNNPSNTAPYHNFYHLQTVTTNCFEGAVSNNMNEEDTENLMMAAIFHDFDHSAGKEKDNINIRRAITGLAKWALENNLDKERLKAISAIIITTEFPYTVASDKLNLSQQIIRDADMSQCLESNWIQQIIFGLGKEMNKTSEEMIKGQKGFLSSIKPITEWFKTKWDDNKSLVFKELEKLEKIYLQ